MGFVKRALSHKAVGLGFVQIGTYEAVLGVKGWLAFIHVPLLALVENVNGEVKQHAQIRECGST